MRALRERVARTLLTSAAQRAGVDITLPNGVRLAGPDEPDPDRPRIELREPPRLVARLADNPKIGIGESYMAGEWAPASGWKLADVLTPFAATLSTMLPGWLLRLRRIADKPLPSSHYGAKADSADNISAHYDLSNDMFAAFLDPTMSYSSALFDPELPYSEQSLEDAQRRKIEAALDLADVGPGMHILEIGTGWGALAIEAARRGARVTTVTLSAEQAELARTRIDQAGLTDSIEVRIQDYRDITGTYDAVVSVEMIEAVGERYWGEYFATLARLVRPGGAIGLQSILMSHERYLATRHSYGWIQKYIFPGGLIPSLDAVTTHAGDAGLAVASTTHFGGDYAETLGRWQRTFADAWPSISEQGFDETFRRIWEFYLAYSEAGFRSGYLDVALIRLERPAS